MTIHFETLGCKLNQIESESAANFFFTEGFSISMKSLAREDGVQNDVSLCVVNTCTVTGKAEQKARRVINLLLDLCPNCPVLVTGCYAELDASLIKSIHKRIMVLPGTKKGLLADIAVLVKKFFSQQIPEFRSGVLDEKTGSELRTFLEREIELITGTTPAAETAFTLSTDTFFQHSRSSIKIQDGCNNHCTYCRIRLARGSSVSLDPVTIIERVQKLEETGHSEVIITGVNLSQYKALYNGEDADIVFLLELLIQSTKKISFRISSLYPERVDEKLCAVLKSERIRPHFHLSVQSGSNRILQLMKRPYKAQQVYEAVNRLRQIKPDAFIACDIIAGFPGETEEDFQRTLEMCTDLDFTWIHAFPFSPRPGTEAYEMKSAVGSQISARRVLLLTETAKRQKKNFVEKMKGKEFKAVVEKRKELPLRAVTENFLHTQLILPDQAGGEEFKGREIRLTILGQSSAAGCEAQGLFTAFI